MRLRDAGALTSAAIGFAASLASLVDTVDPTFCSESGCATVRTSAWAHPLGIPMPVLGIGFFAAMLVLAVVSRPRVRELAAGAGALWAVLLVTLQASGLGWCKLCLVADVSAVAHAAFVLAGARTLRISRALVAIPTAAVAMIALSTLSHAPAPAAPTALPDCVARAQIANELTVVEFVDFECPFCRDMASKLDAALATADRPVHVVRKMKPLPMHPGALPAALAWCCADLQGKGDAMASALFAADPGELTPAGCEQIAARVGCDLARYRRDLASPEVAAHLAADLADAKAAGVHALPTLYIGADRVDGDRLSAAQLAARLRG